MAGCVVLLVLAAGVAQASETLGDAQSVEPQAQPAYRHGDRGGRGPDVDVLIAPRTEHWRGNYRPDGYRLDDYDGVPRSPVRCAGQSGTTISTAAIDCPPGQAPVEGDRRWSTQPSD